MKDSIPNRALMSLAIFCLASCGTVPDQKFLKKGSLSGIRKVGVITSSSDLTVRRHREMDTGGALALVIIAPLAPLVLVPIDWAFQSKADTAQARGLQADRPKQTIAQRFSSHFTQHLLESRVFESIQETPADAKGSHPADWLVGQDAVIRLRITDVSLRPVTQNESSLFVQLSAEMVSLRAGKEQTVLWSRVERLSSNDSHTLEFYERNGIPLLDEILDKLAKRLSDDLIYTR